MKLEFRIYRLLDGSILLEIVDDEGHSSYTFKTTKELLEYVSVQIRAKVVTHD